MDRKRRVVGTAGHIDHGKTALVRALTGIDTDRLPEEKRRGITIDLGFANWMTDSYQIGFVDVPGHERFVKNMLAGIGGIDSVLLVVAGDESIKPQTREHFAICRLLGIPTGVVAITKSDLVDDEILDLVRLEIEELVSGSFLEAKPAIAVSSTTGRGLEELKEALVESVASIEDRDATNRVFRLPIDRAFTIRGFGSVITGTTYSGRVALEDEVELRPGRLRSRARAIQVHGESRSAAAAGERTSMNLSDIPLEELRRGQQVVHPGTLRESQILTVRLDLLGEAKPLEEQKRIRFHHLSSELLGTLRFIDETESLQPGTSAFAQIRLEAPVVAVAGDRFVIRRYSPAFTIGGGTILDAHLPKLSRGTRPEIFRILTTGSLPQRVELMAKMQGLQGLEIREVQARTGITIAALREELLSISNVSEIAPGRWIHNDALADFRRRAMRFVDDYFRTSRMSLGVPKGEFVQKVMPHDADVAVVNFLLADLAREKIVVASGDLLEVPGRSRTLGGTEGELARAIEQRFAGAGLQTPAVSEIIKSIPQKPKVIEGVIGYLVKQGILIRLSEGVYLHRDTLEEARVKLASKRGETIDVAEFKELFGISRKVAIPLLELFDREGATKRVGDARQVL
jgi:selenocysteine-specific elongation factor